MLHHLNRKLSLIVMIMLSEFSLIISSYLVWFLLFGIDIYVIFVEFIFWLFLCCSDVCSSDLFICHVNGCCFVYSVFFDFVLYLQMVSLFCFVIWLPFYINVSRVFLCFRLHSFTHAIGLLIYITNTKTFFTVLFRAGRYRFSSLWIQVN